MKHPKNVTLIIVLLFIASQLVGLALISAGIDVEREEDGTVDVSYADTPLGPRPESHGPGSVIALSIAIGLGTLMILLLAKYNLRSVWKVWYFLAVLLALIVAIGTILPKAIAIVLAVLLSAWKIFRPNAIIHNTTELLVYSGISILIIPSLTILWASVLLAVIAIYDAYAVWKSKHMISLAKFQTNANIFAGLHINYAPKQQQKSSVQSKKITPTPTQQQSENKSAVLGGGDIAFPLVFTAAALYWLLTLGYDKFTAYGISLVIVTTSTISLALLLAKAKKDTFYPAMPFIAAGCYAGLAIVCAIVYL